MSSSHEPVASPCQSICALDHNDVCIGCYRTGMEITRWGRMTSEQQREVVRRCARRMEGEHDPCVVLQE